ncbi:helix-turn-helix transcriptional regulator [Streptomonospora sp. S1-112]|uniref:Helix-turn-helix transcriptional regulator n=1 Tax=Streptomonospora mangrovi TaxID=2883123 RepID=A0A9X3NW34_9ACTN|nr:helix-turn-helix domain-containing protein [Streptomonospora mangrovi]MDA0567950.1 helix-turn-helix transcriptional regulator [Streptomonospora mangrovi]
MHGGNEFEPPASETAGSGIRLDQPFLADCRARLAFDLFTHTWNSVVLLGLRTGPRRPRELRDEIGGISAKVLNQTLRRLADSGLVERRAYAEAPPRVEYGLTPLGETLMEPLAALATWAAEHGDAVADAQERARESRESREGPAADLGGMVGDPAGGRAATG